LWFGKGKEFCERPFALHRYQPENDKQNIDVAPPGKIFTDAHGYGLGCAYFCFLHTMHTICFETDCPQLRTVCDALTKAEVTLIIAQRRTISRFNKTLEAIAGTTLNDCPVIG